MRKLVTVDKILEKRPIEGADKIEAVRVREWWVVAKKDEFEVDDNCLYFEIDSFLPVKPEYEFLLRGSTPKKMLVDGVEKEGIRLKTIKLKGQISQGLALPLPPNFTTEIGKDVSEYFGVIKYEPPIPAELTGKVKGNFPSFVPKTDEERIQNMADILGGYYVAEKLDGTSTTYYKKDGQLGVCSRNLELQDNNGTQWRIAHELNLIEVLPEGMAIQGEVIGEGIQGNPLKINGQKFFAFNVYNINTGSYLNFYNFKDLCEKMGINTVPIINDSFNLPSSVSEMLIFAEGKSKLNQNVEREGVVVRPKIEAKYKGQRLSFKAISNKYLMEVEN